jgi:hypothetical protein
VRGAVVVVPGAGVESVSVGIGIWLVAEMNTGVPTGVGDGLSSPPHEIARRRMTVVTRLGNFSKMPESYRAPILSCIAE